MSNEVNPMEVELVSNHNNARARYGRIAAVSALVLGGVGAIAAVSGENTASSLNEGQERCAPLDSGVIPGLGEGGEEQDFIPVNAPAGEEINRYCVDPAGEIGPLYFDVEPSSNAVTIVYQGLLIDEYSLDWTPEVDTTTTTEATTTTTEVADTTTTTVQPTTSTSSTTSTTIGGPNTP